MNEPEDPGGTSPQVASFVTISRSGMDTEGSLPDTDASGSNQFNAKRKRSSLRKVCKHCNKKKRRHHKSGLTNEFDCKCDSSNDGESRKNIFINENTVFPMSTQSTTIHTASLGTGSSRPPVSRVFYQASDVSPYVVHVQKVQSSPDENCNIHPVYFGHFLKKNSFNRIIDGSLKKIGRNRVSISFSDFQEANAFISNKTLESKNYKAFVPSFNVSRMGIVRGIPTDWSDDDIICNITVPTGTGTINKVRRLKKKHTINGKSEFVPIGTVVITFDGQILPERVFICYNSLPVDLYIYPTIQCFNCCRYGHVKSQCRSTPKCYKCGQGHSGESCSVEEESVTCCLCSGCHMATSKKCPEYFRQRSIKETMAKGCISYAEAIKLHPPVSKSYADILVSMPSQQSSSNPAVNFSDNKSVSSGLTSYKKTVFRKPRPPPQFSKGYDRAAHDSLIKGYNSSAPQNGTALSNSDNNAYFNLTTRDLILTLINSLSQSNIISLPSNVAPTSMTLLNSSNYENELCNSMELSKHN